MSAVSARRLPSSRGFGPAVSSNEAIDGSGVAGAATGAFARSRSEGRAVSCAAGAATPTGPGSVAASAGAARAVSFLGARAAFSTGTGRAGAATVTLGRLDGGGLVRCDTTGTVTRPTKASDAPTFTASGNATTLAVTPPAAAARPAPEGPALLSIWELPYSTRKDLPAIELSMHVYSSTPAQRFVVIKGDRHVEGDEIGQDLILREIRQDGLVLEFKGQRFLFPRNGR